MFRFLCPFAIEMPLPALWPEQSLQDTADMVQTQHSLEQFSANAVSARGNEEEDSISAHDEFLSDMSQSRQETKNPVTTTGAVGTLEKKKHAKENTGLDTKGSSLAVHSETESSVMPNSGMQGTETDHFPFPAELHEMFCLVGKAGRFFADVLLQPCIVRSALGGDGLLFGGGCDRLHRFLLLISRRIFCLW